MDTSVLTRTITITNTHVESDTSGNIEEKWGDASINHKGYTKYDETEISVPDTSIDLEEIRHTHLPVNSSSLLDTIDAINEYYKENHLGPYAVYEFDPDYRPN